MLISSQLPRSSVNRFLQHDCGHWLTGCNLAAEMVTLFAQNEQNMNAVERVLHYTDLPSEGDSSHAHEPPESWPSDGKIVFSDVELAYRKSLPPVLMNVSFEVRPGEKVNHIFFKARSSLTQHRLVLSDAQAPGRALYYKHSSGRRSVYLYGQTLTFFFQHGRTYRWRDRNGWRQYSQRRARCSSFKARSRSAG